MAVMQDKSGRANQRFFPVKGSDPGRVEARQTVSRVAGLL